MNITMNCKIFNLVVCIAFFATTLMGQPEPCGPNPAMTSFCEDACAICDIDGFTGVNDLTAQGQGFSGFCTTQFNNMQYLAFIAGSTDLTIEVVVGQCNGGISSLEVGFFESFDCETFTPITECDTDIQSNTTRIFQSLVPLVIGQHYYLVIDGSNGANCSWTFNVLQGSTEVLPLTTSGVISHPPEACPGNFVSFSTTGDVGAAIFDWEVPGVTSATTTSPTFDVSFPADGVYEVCVTASNVCDEAPISCTNITIRTPGTLDIVEVLCDGDCIEANGNQYCQSGVYQEIIPLPIGCDSTINIEIAVLPQPQVGLDVWICNDDFFFVGNNAYNMTGSYLDTVLTANDCDSLVFLDLLVIECEIIGTTSEIPAICNGSATGTLIFSVDQGQPPLNYTYTNIADGSITGTGTTNLLMDNEIPDVPAGIYQIYITDDFGNDVVVLQEVTEPPILQLGFLPSDYNGFNLSCFSSNGIPGNDGTLTADVIGGVPPYDYQWGDGQMTVMAENLEAVEHFVTITDQVGCTIEGSFTLNAPPAIVPNIGFFDPTCEGFETGIIQVQSIVGGTPEYTFSIDGINYQNDSSFTSLVEGDYELYVKDANDCIEVVNSSIVAPQIPVVFSIEDVQIDLGCNTILSPIINDAELQDISWIDLSTLSCGDCLEPFANPVNDTEYFLTLTSVDGCVTRDSVRVTVNKIRRVFIPNAFSPNGDGINDLLTVYGGKEVAQVVTFSIFDRWGANVFELRNFQPNDPNVGWDGFFNGKEMNPGVLVYTAQVEFLDGVVVDYSGSINIVK